MRRDTALLWTVAAMMGVAATLADEGAWLAVESRGEVVGSADCRRCHPEQHASWHASYHRTMTQSVDTAGAIVLAPFSGETVGCQDCHMPRTTYGLLRGMISHRITSPDPGALLGREDMPDACT